MKVKKKKLTGEGYIQYNTIYINFWKCQILFYITYEYNEIYVMKLLKCEQNNTF